MWPNFRKPHTLHKIQKLSCWYHVKERHFLCKMALVVCCYTLWLLRYMRFYFICQKLSFWENRILRFPYIFRLMTSQCMLHVACYWKVSSLSVCFYHLFCSSLLCNLHFSDCGWLFIRLFVTQFKVDNECKLI